MISKTQEAIAKRNKSHYITLLSINYFQALLEAENLTMTPSDLVTGDVLHEVSVVRFTY